MAYIYDLTDTWNAGGTTFNAIKMNVTDSASASGSKLVTLQTNGTEHFSVTKAGVGYFSGNVGIGTSSPACSLEISSTFDEILRLTSTGSPYASWYTGATRRGYIQAQAGAFNIASDTAIPLIFATNTTERMRIDSAGNVGIGTSSPSSRLHVAGGSMYITGSETYTEPAAVAGVFAFDSTNGDLNISARSNGGNTFMRFFTSSGGTGTERMRIDSSGNVGIGTSSPANKLVVSAAGANGFEFDASSGILQTYNRGSSAYTDMRLYALQQRFFTGSSPTEKMRIDSSGNLLVGTTTALALVNAVKNGGDIYYASQTAAGGYCYTSSAANGGGTYYHMLFMESGTSRGTITSNGSTVSYNTSSDYRLKDIDGPIANSGAYIDALKPVQGSWKADGSRFIGLLAHEVQEVSETPIATGEKDGEEMQAMDYSAPEIIANLIAEIQSLRARVAQLEGN